MVTPACMGGFCQFRASCPRYHATDTSEPIERACEPGRDGVERRIPIQPVKTEEPTA